jgi:hypothetical protein
MNQLRPPARWSSAIDQARWIAERLGSFADDVTSVVPAGFDAYARILHPAQEPGYGERLVRWREVAAWSGVTLRPDAQFHTVALPATKPKTPPPWRRGQGPAEGRLYLPDAEVLAEILRGFTTTPERCFFGLWTGYGFGGTPLVREGSLPAAPLPDPIPDAVRGGPLVELPGREYLLYEGPVEAITATASLGHGQTANLAWPADHAWCLASEIDLAWTYVGGSGPLVERLLGDERVECLPADADDPLTRIEPFVAALVERGVEELLASGHTVIATSMGTVEAWLERPTRLRPGALRVESEFFDGVRGVGRGLVHRSEDLRKAATFRLTEGVIRLVGG